MTEPMYETPDGLSLYLGDCRDVLASLPPESVDCVVTSPPYLGLRAYEGVAPTVWGGDPECLHDWGSLERGKRKDILPADVTTLVSRTGSTDRPSGQARDGAATNGGRFCQKCSAWLGTFGNEPSIDHYVEHMQEIGSAIWRVLKPTGTFWLNVGDGYSGTHQTRSGPAHFDGREAHWQADDNRSSIGGLKEKDLMMVPYRVAIALQQRSWYVRSAITWAKKACMPESVTDRPTCATEMIWLLAKSERYYFDAEAVREAGKPESESRYRYAFSGAPDGREDPHGHERIVPRGERAFREGRQVRNFWLLGPEPTPFAHFATFPREIPRRAILAGSPRGGVVLDPFVGSGTTLLVARQLGRRGIGIDASETYLKDIAIPRLEGQSMALPLEVAP